MGAADERRRFGHESSCQLEGGGGVALVPIAGAIGSFRLRETVVSAQWMDPQQGGPIGDRVIRQVGFFVVWAPGYYVLPVLGVFGLGCSGGLMLGLRREAEWAGELQVWLGSGLVARWSGRPLA